MGNPYRPEDDEDFQDTDDLTPVEAVPTAPAALRLPQPQPLPNPVIKSFEGPAQPAQNTVPEQPEPPHPPQFPLPPYQRAAAPVAAVQPPAEAARVQQVQPPAPVQRQPQPQEEPEQHAGLYVPPMPMAPPPPQPPPVRVVLHNGQVQSSTVPLQQPPDEQDQRQQLERDRRANLRYLKDQGARTTITPTGEEVPETDEQGRQLYHPAVLNPVARGDDGRAYRVSRNELGETHHFDIEKDGEEGNDYHVDPRTGEKYVPVSGADGNSKREVIGQDVFVPHIAALTDRLQAHADNAQTLDLAVAQATHGVQGAGPLQAASIEDLRGQAGEITKTLKPLQKQLDEMASYAPDNDPAANPSDLTEKRQLQDQIKFKQGLLAPVQGEIDARDSTIADARQQKDAIAGDRQTTQRQLGVLQAARHGRMNLQADLSTVATGGLIDSNQARLLANAGLVVPDVLPDGNRVLRVSQEAVSLLDADTRKQIKAAPERFNVMREATPEVSQSVRAVGRTLSKNEPDDAPDFAPVDYKAIADKPEEQARVRRSWANTERHIVARVPGIGVAGSPQNVAFVRAFRASGGDARKALRAAQAQN